MRTYGTGTPPELDARDAGILAERVAALDALPADAPRVGDWVRFQDGTMRRVSHIWRNEDGSAESLQTSAGGSYYLGTGYVSMSGSLYTGVPAETLTRTPETREGAVWFFHHDQHRAHNGIDALIPFRVFDCTEQPTR